MVCIALSTSYSKGNEKAKEIGSLREWVLGSSVDSHSKEVNNVVCFTGERV